MDYTKTVFIKLLANCICEEKKINEIDFSRLDSEELIRLSRINTVSAIVYSSIKDFDEVPKDLLNTLKNEFAKTVTKMSKYDTVQKTVVEKLKEANIPYALVKGKTTAKYYPSISLRDMGDIDVLVSTKDFEEAKKVLDSFCDKKPDSMDSESEVSFAYNTTTIELQNNLASEKNLSGKVEYDKYFADLIDHRISNGDIYEIEPVYSFIFTIYHMAQHFYYTGCGVRMVIDIAVMIKHFRNIFNWEEVLNTLKSLELLEFTLNVFSIIDEWFGIKVPSTSYEKREISDECQEYLINAGIFGRSNINSDVGFIRKNNSFLKWTFPPYSYMRQYSEWFKNKPAVLLPVAYVERIIQGLRKRGGIVQGISVTGQTKRDYEKHQEIAKTMGLE